MNFPDHNYYDAMFKKRPVEHPLLTVPADQEGILHRLPPSSSYKSGWPWTEETNPALFDKRITWPKITVVVPSYNQGDFLEETIRSVLLQNYPRLEFIIIDGGSTDQSRDILQKYSPWISYWQSERDNGQAQAINTGFGMASGDYYAWINSDDYYLKGTIHLVISTFIKYKTEFVYGYALTFARAKNEFSLIRVPPLLDYFIKIPCLAQPSCFWKSTIHQPAWEEMKCAIDYELWLRMLKGKSRKRIRQPLAVANIHVDAKTHDANMKIKWQEDQDMMWSENAHGPAKEWNRIVFLNKIRMKLYRYLHLL